MSQGTLSLPNPPKEYDPRYERRRNKLIEEAMNGKLGIFSPPVFGGVPLGSLTGTDAAFLVLKSVETTLPFDTIAIDNPSIITRPPDPGFDPKFAQVAMIMVDLRVLSDHTNKSNEVILRVYDTDAPTTPLAIVEINVNIPPDSNLKFSGLIQVNADVGKLFFTIEHDANASMIIDMTNSTNSWIQLTINPLFTESNRYGTQKAYDTSQELANPIGYQAGPSMNLFPSRFSLKHEYDE
jgi:hypothetical protein